MKMKWYGLACMVLESFSGIKIICDPYGEDYGYVQPEEEADIVTISHDHSDHNAVDCVKGNPIVIRESGEFQVKGINICGIHSWHDNKQGSLRGSNIIYRFEIDHISFVHMGDIGHIIEPDQIKQLRPCDILAVPVGGTYTVDSEGAYEIVDKLKPGIVIPIHYHTPLNRISVDTEEKFISKFLEVKKVKFWEGTRKGLPRAAVPYVLEPLGEQVPTQ
jgi:L-ascorbate metabolism protein UlaG (beta-lactamase superfamily)